MAVITVAFTSCEDESKVRVPELEKVVNMRLQIDPDYSIVDALDIPAAFLRMDLFTEVSEIEKIDLYVDYYSFNQDSTYSNALVYTFQGSEFVGGTIEAFDLTTLVISAAVGIPLDSMDGGDRLDFTVFTSMADGRMFPDTVKVGDTDYFNATPNILNSAASTSLTTSFTTFIACPVDPNYMIGNYLLETVSGPVDPFFGTGLLIPDTEVNIAATSAIGRRFGNLTYATFGGGNMDLLLVCNNVLIPYTPAPASCGGGLGWIGDNANIFIYDDGDDSEFMLNLNHNPLGDCGLPSNEPWVFKLTKL